MDTELINFVEKNKSEIYKLNFALSELRMVFFNKTKQLSGLVNLENYNNLMTFKSRCFNPKKDFYSSFIIDISKSESPVLSIETFIDPAGWHISFKCLRNSEGFHERNKLSVMLNNLGILNTVYVDASKSYESLYLVTENFPIETSLELISIGVLNAINQAGLLNF